MLLVSVLLLTVGAQAKIVLPDLISDNMVLQQNHDVALWGTAEPNAIIVVTTSWSGDSHSVKADKTGSWKLYVKTPQAGGPYRITFDDGEETVVDNVLVGEVWLCSGQSNMVMPMKGFTSQPVEHAMDYVISAKTSQPIRMCTIKRAAEFEEQTSCRTIWKQNTPENVAGVSATAYFFARRLQETLNVPVGIIVTAWGGSKIEAWMSRETLKEFKSEVDLSFLKTNVKPEKPSHAPTMLYNGMIAPLRNYVFKGVIWYQGCSNVGTPDLYRRLQPVFVNMLREMFNAPTLPFYYVQIAPFKYKGFNATDAAFIREAQTKALKTIPNSSMVVSMDCGDPLCIHPAKKKPVGDRLAFLALQKTYGMGGIKAEAPLYESHEIVGNKVNVTFDSMIGPRGPMLEGFEVAGDDKVFYPADAKVGKTGKLVIVHSDKVEAPVAVRYAFKNVSPASVYNMFGIPASPFRTDDWTE